MKRPASSADRLGDAARQAQRRATLAREDPEPSLARRLGQVGLLGWMIVTPLLLGLLVGRWLDRLLGSGVLFSAAWWSPVRGSACGRPGAGCIDNEEKLMPTGSFWLTGAAVGWLTGWLHFSGLAFNLRLFGEGRLAAALALQWLRIGLSVALLASLITWGWVPCSAVAWACCWRAGS